MLHAPHDPPAGRGRRAGRRSTKLDRATFPGARVVRKQGFLGVVAPREWDAIRAARRSR